MVQLMLGEKLMINRSFDRRSHKHVGNAQAFIAFSHSRCVATRENCNAQSHLDGQLNGISIFDVDGSERFTCGRKYDCLGRKHAIDIKDDGLYFRQIIINHALLDFVRQCV